MNCRLRNIGFRVRRESWLISLFTDGWYLHFILVSPWCGFELCWLSKSIITYEIESGFTIYGAAANEPGKCREVLDFFMSRTSFETVDLT